MTPAVTAKAPLLTGRAHVAAIAATLDSLQTEVDRVDAWGRCLAEVLVAGGRLLAAGNGGSAAQAQHLTSELVGRYRDDRPAFSALALCSETSSVTAIANDYGASHTFARQVEAHGRPGDVLVLLSTSGSSPNVVAAAGAARSLGVTTWALTGAFPNPLASRCDEAVCVPAAATATIQEAHQVLVHVLCAAVDVAVGVCEAATGPERPVRAERAEPSS